MAKGNRSKEEWAAYMRAYRAANREKFKEIDRRHAESRMARDPDKVRQLAKDRTKNYRVRRSATMTAGEREKLKADNRRRNKAYRERHRGTPEYKKRINATAARNRAADPERYKAYVKKFQSTPHGKAVVLANNKVRHHRKRAAKNAAGGEVLTGRQWREMVKVSPNCFYCGVAFATGLKLTMDHKTPITRGGLHTAENVVCACQGCNFRKHDKTAEEFAALKRE